MGVGLARHAAELDSGKHVAAAARAAAACAAIHLHRFLICCWHPSKPLVRVLLLVLTAKLEWPAQPALCSGQGSGCASGRPASCCLRP